MRPAFKHFLATRDRNYDWSRQRDFPRPDYLSSSRKRLGPQLAYKGAILKKWGKKQAIALQRSFYNTLQPLTSVDKEQADIVWFIYDLAHDAAHDLYHLTLVETVYTTFEDALRDINTPQPGDMATFVSALERKLAAKRAGRVLAVSDDETLTIEDV